MDVSSEARSGLPSESLYADDLVLKAPTMEQLGKRVADWRSSCVCGNLLRVIQETDLAGDLVVDGDATTARIRNGLMKFWEILPFLISDIQSTSTREERSRVCQLCQK